MVIKVRSEVEIEREGSFLQRFLGDGGGEVVEDHEGHSAAEPDLLLLLKSNCACVAAKGRV